VFCRIKRSVFRPIAVLLAWYAASAALSCEACSWALHVGFTQGTVCEEQKKLGACVCNGKGMLAQYETGIAQQD
jgi:hypothetical protein